MFFFCKQNVTPYYITITIRKKLPFLCSYFKQNQLYGLSCFERIPVVSQEERNIRMKSVGLLAVGYSDLHLHMEFLQRQVR